MDPFNPFSLILLLLLLEDKLNEELLQLLVAVVDAELLKRVIIKYLKPVNVKYSNDSAVVLASDVNPQFAINVADYPSKEAIIHCL